jgi:hypothetical protein
MARRTGRTHSSFQVRPMASGGCTSRRAVREHIGSVVRDDLRPRAEGSRMNRGRASQVATRAGWTAVGNAAQVRAVAKGARAGLVRIRIHIGAMYRIDRGPPIQRMHGVHSPEVTAGAGYVGYAPGIIASVTLGAGGLICLSGDLVSRRKPTGRMLIVIGIARRIRVLLAPAPGHKQQPRNKEQARDPKFSYL